MLFNYRIMITLVTGTTQITKLKSHNASDINTQSLKAQHHIKELTAKKSALDTERQETNLEQARAVKKNRPS